MADRSSIIVAEKFYSIQGEGKFAGTPAVFLRLGGCNLSCGGERTIETGKLDSNATWRCDTIEVWTKGRSISIPSLLTQFEDLGFSKRLREGAHLVITGGEPLLQSEQLAIFLAQLPSKPFIEIETNGTIRPSAELDEFINSYNVSPKLSNSGMSERSRINSEVLIWFANSPKSIFKFVITAPIDFDEVQRDFLDRYSISRQKLFLMAGADSRESLHRIGPLVAEIAIKHGAHYSPRLHIELWEKKTGV